MGCNKNGDLSRHFYYIYIHNIKVKIIHNKPSMSQKYA